MTDQDSPRKRKPKAYGHDYDLDGSKVDVLSLAIEQTLSEAIYQKYEIEERMIRDLRTYHGMYDPATKTRLDSSPRAKVFMNLVRAKTNAGESQLVDLLFQAEDKNYGIKPTPVPDLVSRLNDESPTERDGQQFQFEDDGAVVTNKDLAMREMEVAKIACEKMEVQIDDQLVQADYAAKARKIIHDACVVGTGILKGPVVVGRAKKRYAPNPETGILEQQVSYSYDPSTEMVRPWDFFPDPSASHIEECEYTFERRYLSRKQVRELPIKSRFDPEKVRAVLKMSAKETQHHSGFVDDVRVMAGLNDNLNDSRYEMWEYHGPISTEALLEWGIELTEDEIEDPLQEKTGIIHYCGGIILDIKLQVIDYDQSSPYRVFNWEEDDSSLFGYGVPHICEDQQEVINSSVRMIIDNAAITAGPQLGINKKKVTPENGSWTPEAFKVWDLKDNITDINQVFTSVEFNSHLPELQGVYTLARTLLDEVSGVPMLQQGEQGPSSPTLGGMSMLMNAANAVRRRQIKQWDDEVTVPMISDFYHFNMMHSEDDTLKGDYQVHARGTSALLVKEQTAQSIANMMGMIGSSEEFAPVIRLKSREIFAAWAKTQTLPADVVPSKEELDEYYKKQEAAQKDQQQQQNPAVEVEAMRAQAAEKKQAFELEVLTRNQQYDAGEKDLDRKVKILQLREQMESRVSQEKQEMMRLAQQDKISQDKLLVLLETEDKKLKSEWDGRALEAEMKTRLGNTGNYGIE